MSKGIILKILLCGFVVFLLLPAVFDEEEKAPATIRPFEGATEFNPSVYDGEESLPILEGAPEEEGNVFTRYAKKFKKMYGRALFGSASQNEQSYEAAAQNDLDNGDEELYYAMAALFSSGSSGGAAVGGERSSYDNGAASNNVKALAYDKEYFKGVPSPVKQTVHDNAPVKGLYETSSTEPYEARTKAKQVYSNVMNKVDRTVPKAAKSQSAFGDLEGEGEISSYKGGVYGSFDNSVVGDIGTDSMAPDLADGLILASGKRVNREYTGISSPRRGSTGGSKGGSYNSYGGGAAREDLNGWGAGFGESFEAAAARTEENVSIAAGIMKDERREEQAAGGGNGGANSQGGNAKAEDGSSQGGEANYSGGAGEQNGGEASAENSSSGSSEDVSPAEESGDTESDGQTQGSNGSNPNNPLLGRDTLFDQAKYDYVLHKTCMDGSNSNMAENRSLPFARDIGYLGSDGNGANGFSNNNPDKIEPLCTTPLEGAQSVEDAINGKRIVVDLGLARGKDGNLYRAVPTYLALSSKGLGQIGILNYYEDADGDINMGDLFKGASISEFASVANNKESIVITVSPAVARAYLGKSVLIEEGDLESKSGLKSLAEKLNNLPAERERILAIASQPQAAQRPQPKKNTQAEEKARKEAADRADIEQKKEEIKDNRFFGKLADLFGGNKRGRK